MMLEIVRRHEELAPESGVKVMVLISGACVRQDMYGFCTVLEGSELVVIVCTETIELVGCSNRICELSVRSSCPNDASQCRYHHSQLPYQWQVVAY